VEIVETTCLVYNTPRLVREAARFFCHAENNMHPNKPATSQRMSRKQHEAGTQSLINCKCSGHKLLHSHPIIFGTFAASLILQTFRFSYAISPEHLQITSRLLCMCKNSLMFSPSLSRLSLTCSPETDPQCACFSPSVVLSSL